MSYQKQIQWIVSVASVTVDSKHEMNYITSCQPIEKDRDIIYDIGGTNNNQINMEIVLEKLKNAQDDAEVCQCMEDLAKYITCQKVIAAFFFKFKEIISV